ncbi:MAG: hypothetical protein Q8O61_16095 [Nocardioides sp.]|nr:hypothetical protein [Nocardioides sp.]
MSTLLWILLGLTVWSVASIPLALVVGRLLRRSDTTPKPASRQSTAPALAA